MIFERQMKWDHRFLDLAKIVASWSKDPSTKCGAVLVRSDLTVYSVGFNGFPRYMNDAQEHLDNREEKYSRVIHAEMNALLHGKGDAGTFDLFTWPFLPCERCFVHMVQAGVERVVAPINKEPRWEAALAKTRQYGLEMMIDVVELDRA